MSADQTKFDSNKKVSFMIVGAQKCGTSSLFHYLTAHPSLQGSKNKEAGFFNKDFHFNQGTSAYHEMFRDFGNSNIRYFDATPDYIYSPYCPKRIFEYNPEMKFILLVRNPVKRAFSAFNMYKMFHSDPVSRAYVSSPKFREGIRPENRPFWDEILNAEKPPSFEKFIEKEMAIISGENNFYLEPALIRRGIYLPQLERYYSLFPKTSFLIFEDRELEHFTENVLLEIGNFLQIPEFNWVNSKIKEKHHVRPYSEVIGAEVAAELNTFYKPHNEAFFKEIGRTFDW